MPIFCHSSPAGILPKNAMITLWQLTYGKITIFGKPMSNGRFSIAKLCHQLPGCNPNVGSLSPLMLKQTHRQHHVRGSLLLQVSVEGCPAGATWGARATSSRRACPGTGCFKAFAMGKISLDQKGCSIRIIMEHGQLSMSG